MYLKISNCFVVIFLLLVSAMANAQGVTKASFPQRLERSAWKEFTPADRSFSLSLPGVPVKQPVHLPANVQLTEANSYKLFLNGADYACDYSEYAFSIDDPETSRKTLDNLLAYAASKLQITFIERKEVSFGVYPGRLFSYWLRRDYVKGEYLIIRKRIYALVITFHHDKAGAGQTTEQDDRDAEKFFSSFKLNPVEPVELNASVWRPFTSADNSFKVLFPVSPRETTDVREFAGRQGPVHTTKAESSFVSYIIIYADLPVSVTDPATIRKLFDLSRQIRQLSGQSNVTSEKEVSVNGYSGREITIEYDYGTIRLRTFVINQRMYSVAAVIRKDLMAQPEAHQRFDQVADRFFASFAPVNEMRRKDGGNNQ